MDHPVALEFDETRIAFAVGVEGEQDVRRAVEALALGVPRPTVVVVGGASGLEDGELPGLESLVGGIVRAAAAGGAAIVDGGTNFGVMRLIGSAREEEAAGVPLVGVVVRVLAGLPGEPIEAPKASLEPRHTHFVLVPGSGWGEESPWIASVASVIATGCPSVTVLVNGGEIAWTDVAASVAAHRRVLAVAGTGRTADALVAAIGGDLGDERAVALVGTGLVEAIGPGAATAEVVQHRIEHVLAVAEPTDAR